MTSPGSKFIEESLEFQSKLLKARGLAKNVNDITVGTTPKEEIYREDKLVLYRYHANLDVRPHEAQPILIVYALVNRPYITDLYESRSLVKGLLDQGLDVYLIDWGYPDASDNSLDMEQYIAGYMRRCVAAALRDSGASNLNLLGICQGGTMSLCYISLYPDEVQNFIAMVTPVDFDTPDNVLAHWFREVDIDLLVDATGNVPGMLLNSMFLSLKPYRLGLEKYLQFAKIIDQPERVENFMRMEKWIFDSPDQAGAMFRTFVKEFFQKNGLIKGDIEINGQSIDLSELKLPVLNLFAKHDHLVPPSSSQAMRLAIGSEDYTESAYDTGHIGIYVSSKAGKDIPRRISRWLQERSSA